MNRTEEKREDLIAEREKFVALIASISTEKAMKKDLMDLTHKYNETKDAAQTVIGALANVKGVTFKSLHEELKVPIN